MEPSDTCPSEEGGDSVAPFACQAARGTGVTTPVGEGTGEGWSGRTVAEPQPASAIPRRTVATIPLTSGASHGHAFFLDDGFGVRPEGDGDRGDEAVQPEVVLAVGIRPVLVHGDTVVLRHRDVVGAVGTVGVAGGDVGRDPGARGGQAGVGLRAAVAELPVGALEGELDPEDVEHVATGAVVHRVGDGHLKVGRLLDGPPGPARDLEGGAADEEAGPDVD